MPEPTEFERAAVATALKKMFSGSHFCICAVDTCMRLLGVPATRDYKALHVLHCVHWSDMPPGMREEVIHKTLEMLCQESGDILDARINAALGLSPNLDRRDVIVISKTALNNLEPEPPRAGRFKKAMLALMGDPQ